MPGGSLTSKPTWPKTFGYSATSAFFITHGGFRPPPKAADDNSKSFDLFSLTRD
jgi:hypothetical protein